jgi:hypothetical protein
MNTRFLRQTGPEKWLRVPCWIAACLVILVKGAGNWSLDSQDDD